MEGVLGYLSNPIREGGTGELITRKRAPANLRCTVAIKALPFQRDGVIVTR
jgi:hypothetical protein